MEPQLQRRIQRYGWDKASACYEEFWSRQLAPAQRRLLQLAELQPDEHVLDVACGTGLVTFPAAAAVGERGRVVGTDLSDRMVERISDEAARRKLDHARFEQMDAETLAFDNGSFDAVLCALGLMYFPNPVKALEEMGRVLRAGGRAVVAVWGRRDRCGWAEVFPIMEARVSSDVCPLFFQLGTGDALRYALERARFRDVEIERIRTHLTYRSAADAIGAAFAGGPVALAYSRFDTPTRVAAHAAYIASIEPCREGEAYRIPGEFVVARGWNR